MKKAVYAGSFDPITNGHVWMIEQGAKLFDELVVAVGVHPDKRSTFSLEERLQMLRDSTREISEVSSSLVKGLIGPQGWEKMVEQYVPQPVYQRILAKSQPA